MKKENNKMPKQSLRKYMQYWQFQMNMNIYMYLNMKK